MESTATMGAEAGRSGKRIFHLALVFFVTVVLQGTFAMFDWMDWEHDAGLLKPALDLVEGKMLYKDVFSQYGALSALLPAVAMRLFDKTLLVFRIEMVLVFGIVAAVMWLICRRYCSMWLSTAAVLLWSLNTFHFEHVFLPWASGFALLFQTLALYFFIRDEEAEAGAQLGRARFLFAAGVMVCATFFSKQNVGAYLLAAGTLAVATVHWWQRRPGPALARRLATFYSGFALLFGIFMIWLVARDALGDWWIQQIKWPPIWAHHVAPDFGVADIAACLFLTTDLGAKSTWIFRVLPLVNLAIAAHYLWKMRARPAEPAGKAVFFAAMVSLASWLQYFPVPGTGQVWWSSTPMWGPAVFALDRGARWWSNFTGFGARHRAVMLPALCLVVFAPRIAAQSEIAYARIAVPRVRVDGDNPCKGLYVPPEQAAYAAQVQDAIDKHVNAGSANPDVVLDHRIGLYLAFVHNAHSFHPIWQAEYREVYTEIYPDFPRVLTAYVHERHPAILTFPQQAAGIIAALPNYKIVAEVGGNFSILKWVNW